MIILELLKKDNYEDWSIRLKTYLEAEDLWDVISDCSNETSEVTNMEWKKKNARALYAIHMSCGADAFSFIRDITSANIAWGTLEQNYKSQSDEHSITSWESANPEMEQNYRSQSDEHSRTSWESAKETFFEAVRNGDWRNAKSMTDKNMDIVRAITRYTEKTGLHIAVIAGQEHIVEQLLALMTPEDLEVRGVDGYTALADATIRGTTSIAKFLVLKNPKLVSIATDNDMIPVVLALAYGHKRMAHYLYSVTPRKDLIAENGINGARLLTYAIRIQRFDFAFDLLNGCPSLAFALDHRDHSPLFELARTSSVFPSGCRLRFWQQLLYNCLPLRQADPATNNCLCIDVQDPQDSQTTRRTITCSGILQQLASSLLKLLGIKRIYDMKLLHHNTVKLLDLMCRDINNLNDKNLDVLQKALWEAIARGHIEFVDYVLEKVPDLAWLHDHQKATIFMRAISFRQPKIFSRIHELDSKIAMAAEVDEEGNNMLHMAGSLSRSSQINNIQGAVLQMQRELQWFKEVERIMSLDRVENKNDDGMTPHQLFTDTHKSLMNEAEKWMKGTAESCTVVGALIVTVMFAVAFTVPGGNNQESGFPIFLDNKLFKIFVISDVISLFSSTASVLMFLGILTSRYAESDFLKSLPTKMIIGLSTLFLSLATMTMAFCVALFITLDRVPWIRNSVAILASLPIILFIWMQFPLLLDLVTFTFGPSIFKRKIQRRLKG